MSPPMSPLITVASTVTSTDGTTIAVDRSGPGDAGAVLVVVDGVLAHRPAWTLALARRLAGGAPPGRAVATVRYDRRGRGDSGFTAPYAVSREIEDLAAVLDAAGPATLLGLSTGAFLALRAAEELGERVTAVVVHQPASDVAGGDPDVWRHVVAAVESCLEQGDPRAAVEVFLDVAGMPSAAVARMRCRPGWADLERHAATIAYDGRLVVEAAETVHTAGATETLHAGEIRGAKRRRPPRQQVTVADDADPEALAVAVLRAVRAGRGRRPVRS